MDDERWERFLRASAAVRAKSGGYSTRRWCDRRPASACAASQLLRQPEVRLADLLDAGRVPRFEVDAAARLVRYRQCRDGHQVRRLSPSAGERDRARAEGRAPADPARLSVRARSRSVKGSRSATVAGSAGHARPGAADSWSDAGSRRRPWRLRRPACVCVNSRDVARVSRPARAARAGRAKAPLTLAMLDPLEAYFRLLTLWNAKINLTALRSDPPTDETFDRLLIEPLPRRRT